MTTLVLVVAVIMLQVVVNFALAFLAVKIFPNTNRTILGMITGCITFVLFNWNIFC